MFLKTVVFQFVICLCCVCISQAQVTSTLVKDVKFGSGDGITRTGLTAQIGSTVYFVGSDVGIDEYLFKTDGTNAGTVKVHPGIKTITDMVVLENTLLFEGVQNGKGLFRSDGTQAGTFKLVDFGNENAYYLQAVSDSLAIFGLNVNGVPQMWVTNGTQAGTYSLGNWEIQSAYSFFTRFQGKTIITDQFNPDPLPIIITDGTVEGTAYLDSTLLALTGLAEIYNCVGLEDLMFVSGKYVLPNGTYNGKTYVTDGTPAGTHEVQVFGTVDKGLKSGNSYYLLCNADAYVYEATSQSTVQIMDGTVHVFAYPVTFYGKTYITGVHGEVYESDGTEEGTQVISVVGSGQYNYYPVFWEFDNQLYYNFRTEEEGVGINRIDLITKKESLFVQFSGYSNVVRVPNLHKTGCKFIFPRYTSSQGYEWWGSAAVPGPPLVIIEDSTALCTSQPVPLQVVNTCNDCTVNWQNGMSGAAIEATQAGNYYCSMSNTCGAGPWSNVVNITTGAPAPPSVVALGDTVLCSGDSVLLLAGNMCSGCMPLWSTGQSGQTIWVSAPGNYTVTYSNACGESLPSEVQTVLSGGIPEVPQIDTPNGTTMCVGDTLLLRVSNVCSGCFVLWSDGTVGADLRVTTPGTYGAVMTGSCGPNNSADIHIQQEVFIPFITTSDSCVVTAPGGGSNYQWYLDSQEIEGATDSVYTAVATGFYSVHMTGPQGCEGISEPVFINCLSGTYEQMYPVFIRVYPNPAQEKIHLKVVLSNPAEHTVHVIAFYGRVIQRHLSKHMDGHSLSVDFDTSDLPAGMYCFLICSDKTPKDVLMHKFEVIR